jgi:uncharacterized membrane protein
MVVDMSLAPHRSEGTSAGPAPPAADGPRPAGTGSRRLRTRLGLGLVATAVVVFLLLFIPKYLRLNPNVGRLDPARHPAYFPVLLVHVFGASVAISTVVLQMWPWLRRRYPVVHRRMGRVFVIAGVWPAAAAAIVISLVWPFGPVSALSDMMLASLWAVCATTGWRFARQRRMADHRRWMMRSFALTVSIILNRLLGLPVTALLGSQLDTTFGGDRLAMEQATAAICTWLPWTLTFIVVEVVLDREQRRRLVRLEK